MRCGCYLQVGGMVMEARPSSCHFTACLPLLLEEDGGGCSPLFMSPCCMLTFAVGGGWWWVMLYHSVAPLFRLIVVVSAGGSACCQVKVVEWGTLVIVHSGSESLVDDGGGRLYMVVGCW